MTITLIVYCRLFIYGHIYLLMYVRVQTPNIITKLNVQKGGHSCRVQTPKHYNKDDCAEGRTQLKEYDDDNDD